MNDTSIKPATIQQTHKRNLSSYFVMKRKSLYNEK